MGFAEMKDPLLQIALDFTELDRAFKVAEEAVAGGADWLEAGTPLIKAVGLDAVRELRRRFPKTTIVADMKTFDAGRVEVETAARAGAAVVHILGVASDSSVAECIAAGRELGARINADLASVENPAKRAVELEKLGVDYLDVHTPIDLQMRGGDPFSVLRQVVEAVSIPVAAAGGLNSETVVDAVEAGASIVIVGGAITKSPDARRATAEIKEAMRTRARLPTRLYKRASQAEEIRNLLSQISTANLSDAMHRKGVLLGLKPVAPGLRLVGPAFTVRTAPGDYAKPVEAIDRANAGDVIVVEAGGVGPAVWGEMATRSSMGRGLAGVVIDGALRDSGDIRALAFPAFSKLVMPCAGEGRGLGEMGVAITVCGVTVEPGDWLLGDDDGVVRIPREGAAEWANRGLEWLERENRIREEILRGGTYGTVTEIERWEKQR
jgi:3-hexulose-6-phosphate synthase/6-phospho-3-hexuloisomerase